jgi:hypothetical protein
MSDVLVDSDMLNSVIFRVSSERIYWMRPAAGFLVTRTTQITRTTQMERRGNDGVRELPPRAAWVARTTAASSAVHGDHRRLGRLVDRLICRGHGRPIARTLAAARVRPVPGGQRA